MNSGQCLLVVDVCSGLLITFLHEYFPQGFLLGFAWSSLLNFSRRSGQVSFALCNLMFGGCSDCFNGENDFCVWGFRSDLRFMRFCTPGV
uniref:Uncharacterized protein n=1 Tax=Helianthus annuus TaxID=4232 RepID=A0A251SB18_HELAN